MKCIHMKQKKTPHLLPMVSLLLLLFNLLFKLKSLFISPHSSKQEQMNTEACFSFVFSLFSLLSVCEIPALFQCSRNFFLIFIPTDLFLSLFSFFLPSFRFFPVLLYHPSVYCELFFSIKDRLKNGGTIRS